MVRIKQERAGLNISQEDLAKKIGVSRATIQNWESGKSEMVSSQVSALSDIFGCTSDWLIGRTNERNKST